ncbi:ATP-binding protein [Janibacter anophelis]|uniref:ATP-binding protein n=1 Tax=Janibacter anophelis TaxID=319054 RepID=UPI003F8223EE
MSPRNTVARVLERLVIVLSVIILLMSVMSVVSMVMVQREVRETTRTISPLNEQSGRMRITMGTAQSSYRAYLLTDESGFRAEYLAARADFRAGEPVLRERIAAAGMDDDEADAFISDAQEWFRLADARVAGREGASVDRTHQAFAEVTSSHDALATQITDVRQQWRDRYTLVMNGAIALMGVATLVAIFVTVSQARRALDRLARPLQALHRAVSRHEPGEPLERTDLRDGADEVVALADAFSSLAASNASMQRERERRLDLYRLTGSVPALLTARDGGWDRACAVVGEGLGADTVSVHRLADEQSVTLMGSWDASGDEFAAVLQDVRIPGVAQMLAETPRLRADCTAEVERAFPPALARLAREQGLEGWALHPLCFGDEAVGVLSVATREPHAWDESELQAMERVAEYAAHTLVEQRYVTSLEDLDRQKSDFTATTSHELRTPLTSIAGYLELLVDGDFGELSPPQVRALDVVSRNVDRLRALIDDLLLLNRLDSGQADTARTRHDVRTGAARVTEQLAPVARAAQVRLELVQDDAPIPVSGDAQQFERAVGNLASNAVKFTPAGGSVILRTTRVGQEVHITCADTGMGIPAEDRERLFTRFFRASNAQEGHVPGTGLGLVIVQTIAEAHGGHVELDSTEGEGTTVTLVLPVTD